MKRNLLLAGALLLAGSTTAFAQTAFEWDFSEGLEGFTMYDVDQRTPTNQAAQYGFAVDRPWITMLVDRDPAAVSNSSHNPIGLAEDWLITPAITVGEGQTLMFKTFSHSLTSATKIGKLDVMLSTTGVNREDFTVTLQAGISVRYQPATLSYDLSEYAGQTIYVAFINKSMQKDFLVIDDIFVGIPPVAYVDLSYNSLQENATTSQRIAGTLTAGGATTVNSYTATLTCGDFSTQVSYDGLNVQPNSVHSFSFNESLPMPTAGEPQEFRVDVVVNGGETVSEEGAIYTQAFQPTKRVVVEEFTGTWCGYCVRGIYWMERMAELYPDNFIGIAVHGGDIMETADYATILNAYVSGYPDCIAMRNTTTHGDPSSMNSYYNYHKDKPAWADVSVYAEWADEAMTQFHAQATTTFATSGKLGMRLLYVLIENDVHGTSSSYNQSNNYAGGSLGAMGGFEDMPSTIPAADMYYQDVARTVYGDIVNGIEQSIPSYVTRDVANKYYRLLDVPSNVLVPANCQLVVLLMDTNTGYIVNAAKCDIAGYNSAVKTTKGDTFASRAYSTYEGIRVEANVAATAQVAVQVYATDGRLVYSASPRTANGLITIDCPMKDHGAYIVRVVADGQVKTHKVIL